MICPHCAKATYLDDSLTSHAYPYEEPRGAHTGYDLSHGFCPACSDLIVVLRQGQYLETSNGGYLVGAEIEEILYPSGHQERRLDALVPPRIRGDFDEAVAVLPHSKKASAAISRRVLQLILRDSYKIQRKTLASEIDAFIALQHIPSYISGAVDAVRQIGNFAAHPIKAEKTGEIVEVEDGEAEWLLEVIETLCDFTFVQPKRLEERRARLNEKLVELGREPMKEPAPPTAE